MWDLPKLSYCRPESVREVLQALRRPGSRIYAGGTDLLVALRNREDWVRGVRMLVDVKSVSEAAGIAEAGTEIRIGSLTTAAQLAASGTVRRHARALAEAAQDTSAPSLRARGTVGGNLSTPHPSGDVTTALLALGASVELAVPGRSAARVVPLAELFAQHPNQLNGRTLVLAVRVPKCQQSAFESLGTRHVFSRSVVAVAVAIRDGRHCVALGGLDARPFVATSISAALDARATVSDALMTDWGTLSESGETDPRFGLAATLIGRARERAARMRSRATA